MNSKDTNFARRTRPTWMTIADAANYLERATAGGVRTESQVLQLCAEGAIPLTLRLDDAYGMAWGPQPGRWWYWSFSDGSTTGTVVELKGLFDIDLDSGGRALVEAIRWAALGKPPRPANPALVGAPHQPSPAIKLLGEDGTEYAMLREGIAQLHAVPVMSNVKHVVASGLYEFMLPEWPLSRLPHAEAVIRTAAIDRWLDGDLAARDTAAAPTDDGSTTLQGAGDSAAAAGPVRAATSTRGKAYWSQVLVGHIAAIDKRHPPRATALQAIAYLKALRDPRLPNEGATDILVWKTDNGDTKKVQKKTIENALPAARVASRSSPAQPRS